MKKLAWIELHQSLWTHKKTFLLAAELEIDEIYAAAHMAHLWCWALDNVANGELSGLPSRVIAFGAGWKGDANTFIDALIKSGWVDQDGDSLLLHDWHDYAGRLIEKRTTNAQRMRDARATKQQRTEDERATHVQRTFTARAGATVPNSTVPNQKKEKERRQDHLVVNEEVACAQEEPSSSFAELAQFIQAQGFGTINSIVAEKLQELHDEYGLAWCKEAIEEAVLANKRSLKYVESALANWRRKGGIQRQPRAAPEHQSRVVPMTSPEIDPSIEERMERAYQALGIRDD